MENKKMLVVLHGVFSIIGIVLYSISIVMLFVHELNFIALISLVLNVIALACGLIYLKKGYKKESAKYYKTYMWVLVVAELFETATRLYNVPGASIIEILSCMTPFALFLLLAGAKDYGKNLSFFISIALLVSIVCQIIPIVPALAIDESKKMFIIIDFIGQFAIAIVTSIMVCEKYIDKEARGTK